MGNTERWLAVWLSGVALMTVPTLASARDFPAGASTPTAAEVQQRLSNTVFSVQLENGQSWRLEYKDNGYFFVDTSTGGKASGQWRAEDGKVCGFLQGSKPNCNDLRMAAGVLHLKRDNGEVVQLIPK